MVSKNAAKQQPTTARDSHVCAFLLRRRRSRHLRIKAILLLFLLPVSGCMYYRVVSGGSATGADPKGSLTLSPQASCVAPSEAKQFTATLKNISGSLVDWYVDGVKNGSSATGTITADGLYGAPSLTGSHVVQAISQLNRNASASATVNVTTTPSFKISPDRATLPLAGQRTFEAASCGVPNKDVTWSVNNVPGGNATVGTITSDGVYTAPATVGTYTIKATDAILDLSIEAVVTVASAIVVDFGSRVNTQHPIPAGILGVNHAEWLEDLSDVKLISKAGFTLSRTNASIPDVYRTRTPNWTAIDPQISELHAGGLHILLQLSFTPQWLQPRPNPCGTGNTKAAPTSVNAWAQLAKSFVAHMDAKFPGVVTDYEIWNEPDSGGMCGTSDKLSTYLALYAAAVPLMKRQASNDGATIRVGGPATANMNAAWFEALLSNPSTAPYVDFVSYHNYIGGRSDVDAAWDTYNGSTPLYQLTQDSSTGAAAVYAQAAQVSAAGKQAGRAAPPIYVDEFNTNWTFAKDCCRDDPTYAPVWNALYVSDLLDTVYAGTAQVPAQLTYYSANTHPYFCLIGEWNADMDCELFGSGVQEPYPQYYAYQLMASRDYLDMNSGGYMAASVSPAASGAGVATTAFYTAKQDSILIVNPTGQPYSQTVSVLNAGSSSPVAYFYQVVQGRSIIQSSLTLEQSGSAYNMTVSVPPYTVAGISIQER